MSATNQVVARCRLGIVVKTFPKVSETFIFGELAALQRQGIAFRILALQQPTEQITHPDLQALAARVDYLKSNSWLRNAVALITDHMALLSRRPIRYARTLWFAQSIRETEWFGNFLTAGRIAVLVERLGLRHLHTHYISQPASIAELVQRLAGTGFSISAHAKDIYLSSTSDLQRKLTAAAFTVTCTHYNCEHLAGLTQRPADVHLMYHGIDTERLQPATQRADHPQIARPLLLSVGRLREKKGFPVLIEACRQLQAAGVNFRCQIIGYGLEQHRLQKLIRAHGLDNSIELLGKLGHAEVLERYRAASVFVLPCQIAGDGDRDGIPNVLLEAMAFELPVVSTRVSGIPEVIDDGSNGLLVTPNDAMQLAAALRRLLGDRLLARRLGVAARRTVVSMFSSEANIRTLCALLLDACPVDDASAAHAEPLAATQWAVR
jgi:glycosyltransferase involved in cell wall biosynthesis